MPMSSRAISVVRASKQAQNLETIGRYREMKHRDKIEKALEFRKAHTPKDNGFKTPGSMNKRKTGYFRGNR